MEKVKGKLLNSIIIAFAFAFNLCVFGPLEFYYSNIFDFWFTVDNVLPAIGIVALIVFTVIFAILYLTKNKIHSFFIRLFFILMMCLYVQGNFLNVGYEVLNGATVDWKAMIPKGVVNTLIWLVIIALPFVIKPLKKDENFRFLSTALSVFIVLIQIITLLLLIFIGVVYNRDSNYDINAQFYLDENGMFDLSKEENLLVFIVDTFEGNYMNEILEKHPEYKEKLKDFIYFDNTTGTSLMTFSAMPTILTGEYCQVGNNLKENIKYCFDNTQVFKVLEENGYETDLYTYTNLIPYEDNNYIDNKVNKKVLLDNAAKTKLSGLLYDCVLYKYMPHFLKSGFLIDTAEFNRVSAKDVNQYVLDDVKFYQNLLNNGLQDNSTKKQFKLYHLSGIHTPYILNEDIKYDTSNEYLKLDESIRRENQILGSLNLFIEYVDKLKEKGLYDNTTIILLADHGWENRYYVNFMVKTKNADSEFKISSAPISITEDFIPTILNTVTNTKEYGKDIWDYKEGDERQRNVYSYTFTRGDNTYNVLSKITVSTKDVAKNIDSYYITDAEYKNSSVNPTKEYKFGKEINIIKNKNMKYVVLEGILESNIRTISKGTNISKDAKIRLKPASTDKDIKASIFIKEVYYDNQTIKISIGDEALYEVNLNKEDSGKMIDFTIPKELWNEKEILEMKLEFPNGKLGDASMLGEETVFMSMLIESIKFEI